MVSQRQQQVKRKLFCWLTISNFLYIIVLLILAGVTLSLALNNNGIIGKSKNAAATYSDAEEAEKAELNRASQEIDKLLGKLPDDATLVDAYREGYLKVGDYVTYEAKQEKSYQTSMAGESQTYKVANNKNEGKTHEITWRVLGLGNDDGQLVKDDDESGTHLLLISGSPVEATGDTPYLHLYGAEGYVNGSEILNGICNIYKNDDIAEIARSVNIDDINTILGIKIENNEVHIEGDDTNLNLFGKLGNKYTYEDDDYTPESYLKGKTAKENGETEIEGSVYIYDTLDFNENKIGNTTVENLLFEQTGEDKKCVKIYWLDSKSALVIGKKLYFGMGRVGNNSVGNGTTSFNSKGSQYDWAFGVRPVILLKSDITYNSEIIKKKTGVTESDWYEPYKDIIRY